MKTMSIAILFLTACTHTPQQPQPRDPVPPASQKCEQIIYALEEVDEALWENFNRHGCTYGTAKSTEY
jgi:hypothetical protein